jgi:hypothetical protein
VSRGKPGDLPTERDSDMTPTYVQVMVLEAVIVFGLWFFGRMFS